MALVTARDFQLVPDVTGAVGQGLQNVRQFQQLQGISQAQDVTEQTRQLTGIILDKSQPPEARVEAQRGLTALNPQAAQQLQTLETGQRQAFTQEQQDELQRVSQAAVKIQGLPTDEAKLAALRTRKAQLVEGGKGTIETDNALNAFESGDFVLGNQLIDNAVKVGVRAGFISQDPEKAFNLKREELDIKKSQNAIKLAEQALNRETDALKRDKLTLEIEEKRNKIDETQKGISVSGQQAIDASDIAIETVDRLLTHPGLESAVGLSSLAPSIPGTDRANFEAELVSFDAKLFQSAIKQMKGMGSLSDAEGRKVSAAAGAINQKMSEKAFKKSLGIIRDNFALAKSRTQANLPAQTPAQPGQQPAAPQQQTGQVLNFDAQGNLIQ